MSVPDWKSFALNQDVLAEPTADASRIVLWVRGHLQGKVQSWRRIASVPRAEVVVREGVSAVAAMCVPMRQEISGFWEKLMQRFSSPAGGSSWSLPTGEPVEANGARLNDVTLVWSDDVGVELDEDQIRLHWPDATACEELGRNLFLIAGVQLPEADSGPEAAGSDLAEVLKPGKELEEATGRLTQARAALNRTATASALTDLAAMYLRGGDAQRATPLLDESIALARQLGDESREHDALQNLGLAFRIARQPERASEILHQELEYVRSIADAMGEKMVLSLLGIAYFDLGDHVASLKLHEEALAISRKFGDRRSEGEILWFMSILFESLGRRAQAIATAEASVKVYKDRGDPAADSFAEHLERFRRGDTALQTGGPPGFAAAGVESDAALFGGTFDVAAGASASYGQPGSAGPSWLRMALSATHSMAKFLAAGAKTASRQAHQKRLDVCKACTHHTGLRCRVCGCFTNTKAWMPHEDCPIGKWPRVDEKAVPRDREHIG